MTDQEIIAELNSGSLLCNVRKLMHQSCARIEQACAQRKMPSLIELRHIEFEAAQEVIDLVKRYE